MVFMATSLGRSVSSLATFGGDLGQRAHNAIMPGFPAFLARSLNRTAGRAFGAFEPALRSAAEAPALVFVVVPPVSWYPMTVIV